MKAFVGSSPLKVLFLSQRFLFPMDDGGKIRTGKLLEKLNKVFELTLISNVESPKDDPYVGQMEQLCAKFYPVPWRKTGKYSFYFYWNLFVKSFSRYPISVANDYSPALEAALHSALTVEKYNLLVCDFLQPSLNFRRISGYPMVLFQHNVESVIVKRHFATSKDPVSKLFWWLQWVKMVRYEREACQRFSGVITVSDVDKSLLEREFGVHKVFAVPTGIDTEFFTPCEEPVEENSLVFIGSMDWLPNEDAVLFFVREILGKIKQQIPGVKVTIVGKNPSSHLVQALQHHPEVKTIGWVEDIRPHLSRHTLSILPLRIGGGTRIKVYEAMAMGKVVVSTRIGVEGLPLVDGEHVVLADGQEEFAQAVVQLLRNHRKRQRIAMAARDFVDRNCGWQHAAESFADICQKVVTEGKE